jgi:predicted nucleotidyltransferase
MKQKEIIMHVDTQLAEWLPEKFGWKRGPHRAYMRIYKIISHILVGRKKWKSLTNQDFGVDEFGRSINYGVLQYVEILKSRGLRLNTVLVMGSRAKGRWKPSSDVDLTIIAENLPKIKNYPPPLNRIVMLKRWFLLSDIPLFMDVEPSQCSNKDVFLQKLNSFDIHALDAIYYGKPIYDDGFWNATKTMYEKTEKELDLQNTDLKEKLYPL